MSDNTITRIMIETAFVGAGNMASAIVRGMLNKGFCTASELACTSARDGTGEKLSAATGVALFDSLEEMLRAAPGIRSVVLAIKPQQFAQLPDSVAELTRGKLIISILAGMPISRLVARFPHAANIVRAMPNTPGQIGAGITAYASNVPLAADRLSDVEGILGSMGPVLTVEEGQLDAVTALSGSGPAYVFAFVEALRDGGIAEGLSPDVAFRLAMHTVLGSALLLEKSGEDPAELRRKVTSPNGTTQAALEKMASLDLHGTVKAGIRAARLRSEELARG